jgi:hypothetical protein
MSTITIKKRANASFACVKKDSNGTPQDVTAITIYAALREVGSLALVTPLTVEKDPGTGGTFRVLVSQAQSTGLRPVTYMVQIEYTIGATKEILDPFPVQVVETGEV